LLYRVKVVKCIDIVLDDSYNSIEELVKAFEHILEYCSGEAKIYVHVLERGSRELADKGIVYTGSVEEALRGKIA